ncbi:peroxisomal membrane protein pex14 [Dimargaris verticillata]|uniref:Peroxisomal membrane protein PEX14 n=1 Tax=Dimargaris verticillata TaxID=2761393 RepID=A0A9W8B682_9FUNG|nr:peroxisomal membrane protein pex14 [Dimargaris verticillata]
MASSAADNPAPSSIAPGPAVASTTAPTATGVSSPGPRHDLIQSAVRFLTDPKVQSSSLDKRTAFLQSKGMTKDEIDAAVAQAGLTNSSPSSTAGAQPNAVGASQVALPLAANPYGSQAVAYYPPPPPQHYPPPVPRMHWKDYFIAAVVASGVGYGLFSVTRRYLIPYVQQACFADLQDKIDQDREKLQTQLDSTQETLTVLQDQSSESLKILQSQNEHLQKAIDNMTNILEQWQEREDQRVKDIGAIKADFDSINKLLPDAISKSKDTQSTSFQSLQSEIRSLKTLLLTRRAPSTGGAGSASPAFNGTASNSASPRPDGHHYAHSQSSSVVASPNLEESSLALGASSSSYAAKAAAFTNRNGATPTSSRSGIPAWQLAQSSPAESSAVGSKDGDSPTAISRAAAETGETGEKIDPEASSATAS